ncbi:hypothetical protein DVH29_11570 [Pelagibacterium lacus]|uniref:Uncharacterized protein n=1 Tax=Pelagibacterium lacus TaxID=2282655 RepID=A0A369W1W9_9HYPH|nr:hypothetical protein DVH29_11570 [Pelagibacterium lacus]
MADFYPAVDMSLVSRMEAIRGLSVATIGLMVLRRAMSLLLIALAVIGALLGLPALLSSGLAGWGLAGHATQLVWRARHALDAALPRHGLARGKRALVDLMPSKGRSRICGAHLADNSFWNFL